MDTCLFFHTSSFSKYYKDCCSFHKVTLLPLFSRFCSLIYSQEIFFLFHVPLENIFPFSVKNTQFFLLKAIFIFTFAFHPLLRFLKTVFYLSVSLSPIIHPTQTKLSSSIHWLLLKSPIATKSLKTNELFPLHIFLNTVLLAYTSLDFCTITFGLFDHIIPDILQNSHFNYKAIY